MKHTAPIGYLGYSPREAAKAFKPTIAERRIRRAIRDGSLRAYRVGSHQVVLAEDLIAFVRSHPEPRPRNNGVTTNGIPRNPKARSWRQCRRPDTRIEAARTNVSRDRLLSRPAQACPW
jgi:hypothetical protein